MKVDDLVINTDRGLYCPRADVYIDAWKPVPRTIVTHGHSDHARAGSQRYLCAREGRDVLKLRIGDVSIDTLAYGETLDINGVKISLHPAGHLLGSAQVRLEHKSDIWVITGDYKLQHDSTCAPFELVRCNTFITECTFGLPIFHWGDPADVLADINAWWRENVSLGRSTLLLAYSLGKAQRILAGLEPEIGPILLHGAVTEMTAVYDRAGVRMPATMHASAENATAHKGRAIIIAPPSAMNGAWARKFAPFSVGAASGWMQIRGMKRRRGVDRGFVLSDHVDWPGLLNTITATGATRIIATHGYTQVLARLLRERGHASEEFATRFSAEDEAGETTPGETLPLKTGDA